MSSKRSSLGRSKRSDASVKVVVRVRPANKVELKASSPPVVQVQSQDNSVTVVKGSGKSQQRNVFKFDHVFGTYATQKDIFERTLAPIVDDVLSGVESTVFAYGQTGTGKTYTMEGVINDEDGKGVIPRAVEAIFRKLQQPKYLSSDVAVSFLEIYNEDLTDLLTNKGGLTICSDGHGKIVCKGLSQQPIGTSAEVLRVLKQAQVRRQTGETKMNKQSSRSHCLFTLQVRSVERVGDCDLERTGKLHLVDLAGSECAKSTGATGSRLRESQNINQSLLTLGRVISALREKSARIPYRDSKLTRLLSQALGGACRTCIIATLSPSALCAEESMSTLHYARRAHGIKNQAVSANVRMSVNGAAGNISAKDSATFVEMQQRLDYMENQMLEAQTALARQHEANVALQAKMDEVAAKEAATRHLYDETCVTLEKTRATLKQTEENLETQVGFTQKLQGTLKTSINNLGLFADKENAGRVASSNTVKSAIEQQSATVAELSAEANTMLASLQSKSADLTKLVTDFSSDNISKIQECAAQQQKLSSELSTAMQTGLESITEEVSTSFASFLNAEDALTKWGKDTQDELKEHLQSLETQLQQQERKILDATEFFHRNVRSHLAKYAERQAAINSLSKAAREHASLGAKHLVSLDTLCETNVTHMSKLQEDLELHLQFINDARSSRANGQQDKELLDSVAATSAILLAGTKATMSSLSEQRNLISSALDFHKERTADAALQKQLDDFQKLFNDANTAEHDMIAEQASNLESAINDQVEGTIDAKHHASIKTAATALSQDLHVERDQLTSLLSFQETATKELIAKVMDGVRQLVTAEVTDLKTSVEERVAEMQGVNNRLEAAVAAHTTTLGDETTTWAANNHKVADQLLSLKADALELQGHLGETRSDVGRNVASFGATAKAWGDANREVDGRMATAVSQNDAMHHARTQLTEDLKAQIASTTAEAEAWANTGNECDMNLKKASSTIENQLQQLAAATHDHSQNFDTVKNEATLHLQQSEAQIDGLGAVASTMEAAVDETETFKGAMAKSFDTIAEMHSEFTTINAEVHSTIQMSVTEGLAPRAEVREEMTTNTTDMLNTIKETHLTFESKVQESTKTLDAVLDARTTACETMCSQTSSIAAAGVQAVQASKDTIDSFCAALVEEQMKAFDSEMGKHNAAAGVLVTGAVAEHTNLVQEAIAATSGEGAIEEPVSPSSVATSSTEASDVTEENSEDTVVSAPVPEEQSKETPQCAAPEKENAENVAPKKTKANQKTKPSRGKSTRIARLSKRSSSGIPSKRVLRPRAGSKH